MQWLKHILTGKDGVTHDVARHSWVWTTLATIGGAAWNAAHAGVVDLAQFAQAIGVLVAAHGGAIWAKKDTEPSAKE